MKVAVSYLSSDNYKKCISDIDKTSADYIHVDLCDGKYVETKNFILSEAISLLKNANKKLDIHLMCMEPIKYIEQLAFLNTETITFHPKGCNNVKQTIEYIKNMGLKVGIAINPDEDLSLVEPYYEDIDEILFMSVYPGKGGQSFIPEVVDKIIKINEVKENYRFITAIDGGINSESINYLIGTNIDMLISGSYITNSADYEEQIKSLKNSL